LDTGRLAVKMYHFVRQGRKQVFMSADEPGRNCDVVNAVNHLVMRISVRRTDNEEFHVLGWWHIPFREWRNAAKVVVGVRQHLGIERERHITP
jgi:hypothetical protein